jgi:hypothetical protein
LKNLPSDCSSLGVGSVSPTSHFRELALIHLYDWRHSRALSHHWLAIAITLVIASRTVIIWILSQFTVTMSEGATVAISALTALFEILAFDSFVVGLVYNSTVTSTRVLWST